MTLALIALYFLAVLAIGLAGHRRAPPTGEDYFAAGRSIGPFVLLMSIFGTHMTAFSILGASGESYHRGVGVFALMASSTALVAPAVFFFLGTRLWTLGKTHGYLTQVQYFRDRWGSDALGLALFVLLVVLLVPYLLIGVRGGGVTLAEVSGGAVPTWVGSLAMCAVVLAYVTYGGMRGTSWANTFQTVVFLALGGAAFAVIVGAGGGWSRIAARLAAERPDLLVRGDRVLPLEMLSYMAIPLSVAMFPHVFAHWLTARRVESFRLTVVAYPFCLAAVWLPSVLLGLIGALEFPGLSGPAANSVLLRLVERHAPGLAGDVLAAGIFAAVVSSLDSQVLALANMFTQDVVRHYRSRRSGGAAGPAAPVTAPAPPATPDDERRQVRVGRLFVAAILAVTFLCSLVADSSIFKLGVWAFTGFAGLFPVVAAALFWRRSTWQGAMASVATTAALWLAFLVRAWNQPGYTVGGTGLMPVAVVLAASTLAMVGVSLATAAPEPSRLARFFPEPVGAAPAPRPKAAGALAGGRGRP